MGGLKSNEKCETKIQGLYAIGYVAGDIRGENRFTTQLSKSQLWVQDPTNV